MSVYSKYNEKITIIIPCFNQPKLLDRCLNSIKFQSYKDYKIILIDDCSSISYEEVLNENTDMPLSRQINAVNLGAMYNLLHCIKLPVSTKYKIVFHEDDLMHPFLIESLLSVMENNSRLIATGSEMSFFRDDYYLKGEDFDRPVLDVSTYTKRSDLIYDLVKGIPFCFGSIIYRSDYLKSVDHLDLQKYWSLSDRPFLINFLPGYHLAIIHNPLVFYNEHYHSDFRSARLNSQHILNFFEFYKVHFSRPLKNEVNFFNSIISRDMISSYRNLYNSDTWGFAGFVISGFSRKIFKLKYFIYHFFRHPR
jgi:glycosyltransferase involved in cell wall biosynthesis